MAHTFERAMPCRALTYKTDLKGTPLVLRAEKRGRCIRDECRSRRARKAPPPLIMIDDRYFRPSVYEMPAGPAAR